MTSKTCVHAADACIHASPYKAGQVVYANDGDNSASSEDVNYVTVSPYTWTSHTTGETKEIEPTVLAPEKEKNTFPVIKLAEPEPDIVFEVYEESSFQFKLGRILKFTKIKRHREVQEL